MGLLGARPLTHTGLCEAVAVPILQVKKLRFRQWNDLLKMLFS